MYTNQSHNFMTFSLRPLPWKKKSTWQLRKPFALGHNNKGTNGIYSSRREKKGKRDSFFFWLLISLGTSFPRMNADRGAKGGGCEVTERASGAISIPINV